MFRLLLVIAVLCGFTTAAAQDFATAVKSTEVVPGIYLVEGADGFAGGNITLLVGEEHVVLIDDGVEPVADALIASVAELAGRQYSQKVIGRPDIVRRARRLATRHFLRPGDVPC